MLDEKMTFGIPIPSRSPKDRVALWHAPVQIIEVLIQNTLKRLASRLLSNALTTR
jgi:hypothetical protein